MRAFCPISTGGNVMLKPIPIQILTQTATLKSCLSIDAWQSPTWQDTTLQHICIQPTHSTVMQKDNTQVTLNSVLFIDARFSSPQNLDIEAMQNASLQAGSPMEVIFNGNTYTVVTVETLYDDTGNYHHSEVGLA